MINYGGTAVTVFLILILFTAVFFLSVKLYSIKKQLQDISWQLKNQGEQDTHPLSIDFVDVDVVDMTVQINAMIEKMQLLHAQSRRKEAEIKSSIALISHDMRTPLTSVIGYLQLAEKSCKEKETLENIRIAKERADYCNKLVQDFFELSAAESEAYEFNMQKVDISALLCEQILADYPNFEKKKITPVFEQKDKAFYVQADVELLKRVLQNLITNSINYSSGTVVFQLSDEKGKEDFGKDADSVVLTISNSVKQQIDAEKVFDRFYRADSARSTGGSGLGLYICRRFIENMGGRIWAECGNGRFVISMKLCGF